MFYNKTVYKIIIDSCILGKTTYNMLQARIFTTIDNKIEAIMTTDIRS